jgi:hypothetical protein
VPVNRGEGRRAVRREHHVMTVGAEEAMEQGADGFSIVGNQHTAPPCFRGRFAREHNFSYRLP